MWDVFLIASKNIGMGFENILLLLTVLGGFIFYAKDFKVGILIQFLFSGLLFLWFWALNLNYVPSMVVFFITLVIMSFTFYAISKSTQTPIT